MGNYKIIFFAPIGNSAHLLALLSFGFLETDNHTFHALIHTNVDPSMCMATMSSGKSRKY
jgi:hypothetical protein